MVSVLGAASHGCSSTPLIRHIQSFLLRLASSNVASDTAASQGAGTELQHLFDVHHPPAVYGLNVQLRKLSISEAAILIMKMVLVFGSMAGAETLILPFAQCRIKRLQTP